VIILAYQSGVCLCPLYLSRVIVVCRAGRRLWEWPIPRPGESYCVCVIRCDSNTVHLHWSV